MGDPKAPVQTPFRWPPGWWQCPHWGSLALQESPRTQMYRRGGCGTQTAQFTKERLSQQKPSLCGRVRAKEQGTRREEVLGWGLLHRAPRFHTWAWAARLPNHTQATPSEATQQPARPERPTHWTPALPERAGSPQRSPARDPRAPGLLGLLAGRLLPTPAQTSASLVPTLDPAALRSNVTCRLTKLRFLPPKQKLGSVVWHLRHS